jgi:hypothetical protein
MARHEIHQFRNRRSPKAIHIALGLGVWLTLGLLSQAAFQVLG